MKIQRRNAADENSRPVVTIVKCLVGAYALTGILLLFLAFVLYQFGMTEKTAALAIIVIYAGVTFIAGLLAGKMLRSRKFIWGLITGSAYFLILLVISLVAGADPQGSARTVLTTACLCAGGGMLGGMVS